MPRDSSPIKKKSPVPCNISLPSRKEYRLDFTSLILLVRGKNGLTNTAVNTNIKQRYVHDSSLYTHVKCLNNIIAISRANQISPLVQVFLIRIYHASDAFHRVIP